MTNRRLPSDNDLKRLAEVLYRHQVEYVLIGGGAMALHGFPRGTKDIDLFLPVTTLDVDGMLLTKQTTRDADLADRNKLQRLINARNHAPK